MDTTFISDRIKDEKGIGLGGPKKPTLSQAEKKQLKAQQKEEKKDAAPEKSVGAFMLPDEKDVVNFIRSMRYATPALIAEKYGTRLSVAKSLLNTLASKGFIMPVVGDNRIRIYAPVQQAVGAKVKEEAKQPVAAEQKAKASKKKKA